MRGVAAALAATLCGCAAVGAGKTAVHDIAVRGNHALADDEILGHIATQATPRRFGLFSGLGLPYALYSSLALQRDLARIERLYRARGYYRARVRAGRIRSVGRQQVLVEIVVDEGPAVLTASAALIAPELDPALRAELQAELDRRLPAGKPFDEDAFKDAEPALRAMLTDRGYAFARVARSGIVDVVHARAYPHYRVDAGAKAVLGPITIAGRGEIPEERVRQALGLRPGDPYSTAALTEAEQRLLALRVFSAATVTPELGADLLVPKIVAVPIRVQLTQARLRAVRLGGGIQLDALKSDVHLMSGWENDNFLGGMRHFEVAARAGAVLYPLRINNWVAPEKPLPEAGLRSELKQPGLFEARTAGLFALEGNAYAVLLKTNPAPTDPVIGYLDLRGSAGLERNFGRLYGSASQHVEWAMPFAYAGALDPALTPVTIVYPQIQAQLDLRDRPAEPHFGGWFGLTAQSALFGTGRDVKLVPEARGYLPVGSKVTLASRLRVGLLLPFDYGSTLEGQLDDPFAPKSAADVRDLQLLFFRGLFAGGTDSDRGYPPRSIAPHTIVPFLNPQLGGRQISPECDRTGSAFDPSRCSVPVGGLTSWEASLELRMPLFGDLGAALFCDAADVAPGRLQFRADHLHLSCGAGARYTTPLGAIRLDVGYRIPGAQFPAGADPIVEGDPGTFFGAPVNLSLGVGEAF